MDTNDFNLSYPKAVVGQIKLGLLNPEDALVFAITVTLFKTFGPGPTYGLITSIFTIYLYKKATAGQPPGFLAYRMSCLPVESFDWPVIGGVVRWIARVNRKAWLAAGSLPPHTLVKRYER